jgi:SAM-dependent methyltransferase
MDDTIKVERAGKSNWFRDEPNIFQSAVRAVQIMLPSDNKNGFELTCSANLLSLASGIPGLSAQSLSRPSNEAPITDFKLPYENFGLDYVFISYCDGLFGGDPLCVFKEVYRVLKTNGQLIVAFIDLKSPDGKAYVDNLDLAADAERIMFDLTGAGFRNFEFVQTLFAPPDQIKEIQFARPGYGEGSFVIVQAHKKV